VLPALPEEGHGEIPPFTFKGLER
jgi:hypothetical protein